MVKLELREFYELKNLAFPKSEMPKLGEVVRVYRKQPYNSERGNIYIAGIKAGDKVITHNAIFSTSDGKYYKIFKLHDLSKIGSTLSSIFNCGFNVDEFGIVDITKKHYDIPNQCDIDKLKQYRRCMSKHVKRTIDAIVSPTRAKVSSKYQFIDDRGTIVLLADGSPVNDKIKDKVIDKLVCNLFIRDFDMFKNKFISKVITEDSPKYMMSYEYGQCTYLKK